MAVLKPTPSGYYLWDYVPSRVAAIVAAVLFGIGTAIIVWRSVRTKTRFAIPFIVGGIFEVGGYIGRIAAQDATDSLPPYIVQYILILVAPALFAASIYMILGRVIRSTHGDKHSLIKPTRLTRIFVWGDVVSFWTQVAGGSLQSMKKFNKDIAQYIVLGGLVIQVLMFSIFAIIAVAWHRRMKIRPTNASLADSQRQWEAIMYMLYAVSVMIMVRSIFRVIEYGIGRDGYLLSHEWPMYVFDSALMVVTVFVFGWWYPGVLVVPDADRGFGETKYSPIERADDEQPIHYPEIRQQTPQPV